MSLNQPTVKPDSITVRNGVKQEDAL